NHHNENNPKGNKHFKGVDKHVYEHKHKFWHIDFGDNTAVFLDKFYAVINRFVKVIPHRQPGHNKHREMRLFCFE
ncbi:MAG: hypothetical protein PHR18_04760, partial [Oscillospiraceae bacterium]|nr:hypothetical protein [Oscillospiraceae bacterium]